MHLYSSMLQCIAVSCSVLQCVAVCRSVLQCVAVGCSVVKCDISRCAASERDVRGAVSAAASAPTALPALCRHLLLVFPSVCMCLCYVSCM